MTEKLEIPPYRSRVNTDILRIIPPDAETILEIGCGTGELYDAFKRINPFCKWYAVEPDVDAANEAAKRGIYVAPSRIEECDFNGLIRDPVDVLILGDCLEHMEDPWMQLRRLVSAVKPSGQVIASIPNIVHWTAIVSLLQGEWPYADEGLFDRGHLRQFTLSSIRELFAQASLKIFDIRGRCFTNEQHGEFMKRVQAFGDCVGVDLESLNRQSQVLQYLIRAINPNWVKIAEPMYREGTVDVLREIVKMHVHCIVAEECCSRPRIIEPMNMIVTTPGIHYTIGQVPDPTANIIIIQRARGFNLEWYKSWIGNRILVAEIDDDPRALQGIPEADFMSLKACHAIQCSTEPLAEICRTFNPNVQVFPNQIAELPPLRIYDDVPHPVKIFFGTQNRENDWWPIMDSLNRVLSDHPDVQMVVVHDQKFFDALTVSPDRKTFSPWLAYPEYRALLRTCDIALLPLEPTPFNEMKSDIGFIEAAAEGVAVLASETVYRSVCQGDWTDEVRGWHYNDPNDFHHYLRRLIREANTRQTLASAAYNYVKSHRMLGQHYRERLCWYQDLLSRKTELDQSLLDRVPELQASNVKTS